MTPSSSQQELTRGAETYNCYTDDTLGLTGRTKKVYEQAAYED